MVRGKSGHHARRRPTTGISPPTHPGLHLARPRHARRHRTGRGAVPLLVLVGAVVIGALYVASSAGEKPGVLRQAQSRLSIPTSTSSTSPLPAVAAAPVTSSTAPPAPSTTAPVRRSAPARTIPVKPAAPHNRAPTPAPVPSSRPHVMMIMMENETYSSVIGNGALPFLNVTLASHYLVLQQAFAVGHPSLPNYLDVLSGSTWGVSSDCSPGPGCQGGTSLPNQLDQAGISWAGYMESMPVAGYTGGDAGGADGYGNELYAQHHNPFVYFPSLAAELSTHVKPLTSMVGDLGSPNPPDFVWVTPNMVDDMHDGPLGTGDRWLSQQIPTIQASPWYRAGGVILVLWDEGQDSDTSGIAGGAGGHVAGIVISQALAGNAPNSTPIDDTGILRSIEKVYGLSYLNAAADPAHGSLAGL
jgi:hypothetical protein